MTYHDALRLRLDRADVCMYGQEYTVFGCDEAGAVSFDYMFLNDIDVTDIMSDDAKEYAIELLASALRERRA